MVGWSAYVISSIFRCELPSNKNYCILFIASSFMFLNFYDLWVKLLLYFDNETKIYLDTGNNSFNSHVGNVTVNNACSVEDSQVRIIGEIFS